MGWLDAYLALDKRDFISSCTQEALAKSKAEKKRRLAQAARYQRVA
jgi:hypothetical protein